jgi:hypothetical protein
MARFHQFATVVVEDCIKHYNGEFFLGELYWLQWCLGDLDIGFNACQCHLLLNCSYFSSTIRPHYCCFATCVLGRAALGTCCALVRMEFPVLAASIFLWSLAILLNHRGPSGCCGDDLSVVSIPIFSSTLGIMAYSCATLGIAAGSWLPLSACLGDCRGIGACCVGAVISCSSFPSILGSRISCSF